MKKAQEKDPRYTTIRNLISGGYLKLFREMFPTVPISIMAKDLGMNYNRFQGLTENVKNLKLNDIFRIAALIGIEENMVLDMVWSQYVADKASEKK